MCTTGPSFYACTFIDTGTAMCQKKKNDIFVVNLAVNGEKYKIDSDPINMHKSTDLESPLFPQGDASDYAISPDASQIDSLAKINTENNAWQNSAHTYTVSTTGKEAPVAINKDIPAALSSPRFTSSGLLLYFYMMEPQYESDRNRIITYDLETKERKSIAESWDSSLHEVVSSNDGKALYVTAEKQGRNKIFAIDLQTNSVKTLTNESYALGLSVLPSGNLFFGFSSMKHHVTPHLLNVDSGELKPLAIESGSAQKLENIDFSDPEDIRFIGALNQEVHDWFLKSTGFEEGKKYLVAFLIHSGPQDA